MAGHAWPWWPHTRQALAGHRTKTLFPNEVFDFFGESPELTFYAWPFRVSIMGLHRWFEIIPSGISPTFQARPSKKRPGVKTYLTAGSTAPSGAALNTGRFSCNQDGADAFSEKKAKQNPVGIEGTR